MPQCTVCQCYNGVHRCWLFVISMGANTPFPPTCFPSCFLAPSSCKTIPFLQYYRTSVEALLASGLCAIDSAYNGSCVTLTAMNSLYNERCLFTLDGVGPVWKINMKRSAVWLQFFQLLEASTIKSSGAWFTKYLTIMPKLRLTYDGPIIYQTSCEGRANSYARFTCTIIR